MLPAPRAGGASRRRPDPGNWERLPVPRHAPVACRGTTTWSNSARSDSGIATCRESRRDLTTLLSFFSRRRERERQCPLPRRRGLNCPRVDWRLHSLGIGATSCLHLRVPASAGTRPSCMSGRSGLGLVELPAVVDADPAISLIALGRSRWTPRAETNVSLCGGTAVWPISSRDPESSAPGPH